MIKLLEVKENIRIIFASAPSQMEFIKALRGTPDIDWKRVTVFRMDEYTRKRRSPHVTAPP